jgi:hypothetical protein
LGQSQGIKVFFFFFEKKKGGFFSKKKTFLSLACLHPIAPHRPSAMRGTT